MSKYEDGDVATYYFIVSKDKDDKYIKGWTDDKKLAKFYLEFHKHPDYEMKSITKTIEEIYDITEEHIGDEIELNNIYRLDRHKREAKPVLLTIPATKTEMAFVREEINSLFATKIRYTDIASVLPVLKTKYRKALETLLINEVLSQVVYRKPSHIIQQAEFDMFLTLIKSFPEDFR